MIEAYRRQRVATDPSYSAWVAANAGSGKTHVLVDRIARLLLSGSSPDRLLCLTFTRAAAAEMSTRLFKRLGEWTLISDEDLQRELERLTGLSVSTDLRDCARRLFANALESPGGLRIQTIHAFCERLLKRFPLEAGVVPQFSVLDERATEELLEEAKERVLRNAAESDAALADALSALTEYAGEERFDVLMRGITAERNWLGPFLAIARPTLEERIWTTVQLEPGADDRAIVREAAGTLRPELLTRICFALKKGSVTDKKRAAAFERFAAERDPRSFETLSKELLTQNGELRRRMATAAVVAADASIVGILEDQAKNALSVRGRLNAHFVARHSANLLRVSHAVLNEYREIKNQRAVLDYDDLITRAVSLFQQPGASWILYKLDGGIDHILVDEAQDTSPAQWKIVTAIAEEFFAGLGAERRRAPSQRTVFAVGDVKQSIMSFQGARPASFKETRTIISEQAFGARAEFEFVGLTQSFRSAPNILEFVDQVFEDPEASDGVMIDEVPAVHEAVRKDVTGLVELWPVVEPPKTPEAEAWDAPRDRVSAEHPSVTLAQAIAVRIGQWLKGGEVIYDKDLKTLRRLQAGDIMILVRRRNLLAEEIIRQLKRRAIPVAGADRLKLADHIAVKDLIALGRFALMPRDDLTLATVLKSPLCGIDEEALFDLAYGRERTTLWQRLRARAEDPRYAASFALLDRVWDQADQLPPYEFYASVLCELGGWKKMLARLGLDAADPIEEFMNAALDFERAHTPSLEAFLHAIENAQTEIKRDQDRGEGSVRVMTVHAAKGLEAPVVILPDTCTTPRHGRHDKDLLQAGETPLWKIEPSRDDPVRARARGDGRDERMCEYRRLLYVALTRARDRLYICGYVGVNGADDGCWYQLVERAMDALAAPSVDEGDGGAVRRFGETPSDAAATVGARPAAPMGELPAWLATLAPEEPLMRHVAPSLASTRRALPAVAGAVTVAANALERGRVIHRILERTAALSPENWGRIAGEIAAADLIDPATAQSAVAEALRVRRDLLLAHVFGEGSYGEVPLRAVVEWQGQKVDLAARLDRVIVSEREVTIIEFKTDRVVPQQERAIPPSYVTQLALYRAAVAPMFAGRAVKCGILWTVEPRLMNVPSGLLEEAGARA